MTAYSGGQGNVYIQPEATYGTMVNPVAATATASTTTVLGIQSNVNFSIDNSATTVRRIGSRAPADVIVGPGMVTGSVDFNYYGLYPLYWALGAVADTDATAPWTWTITDSSTLPPFTLTAILDGTIDLDFQVGGCICTGVSMAVGTDGPITGTMGFIGNEYRLAGATTPQAVSIDDAPANDAAQLSIELPDSTALTNVTNFSLDIANSAAVINRIGARKAPAYTTGGLDITGSFDVFVQDTADGQDLLQRILGADAATTIANTVAETTLTLDYQTYADDDDDSWEISLSSVTLNTGAFALPLDGPSTISVGFIAEDISATWEAPIDNSSYDA